MAEIDWPEALPCPQRGIMERRSPSYAEDTAQVGASRRRRRFSRQLRQWQFTLSMTAEQADALRTFVDTETEGGVAPFFWSHPNTGVIYEVRFASLPDISEPYLGKWLAPVILDEM